MQDAKSEAFKIRYGAHRARAIRYTRKLHDYAAAVVKFCERGVKLTRAFTYTIRRSHSAHIFLLGVDTDDSDCVVLVCGAET